MKFSLNRSLTALGSQFEKRPRLEWVASILWIAGIGGLAFLWNLGSFGLVDETEPLFAEAARQMTVTGDWITPYFNEATRFDKPPLIYWLMAIAYRLVGVNEWAVRLPSALAAIALTAFSFITLRHFGLPRPADAPSPDGSSSPACLPLYLSAFIGSGIMALTPQAMVWGRTGVSDMLLSSCMGCALLAFFWGYVQPPGTRAKPIWYLLFYVLVALAVLTKGPVGLVIPGLTIGVFLLYLGNWRTVLREMLPLRGLLLLTAIAIPWFVLVIQANGEIYINSFFGYHNLERFTQVVNRHRAPWFFYFLVVLGGFAPYSTHLPVAIARLRFWQRSRWQQAPRSAQLGLFALVWFGVIFGFFTIAVTKLPSYVLPLLPAAAILVGLFWSDQITRPSTGRGADRGVWLSHLVNVGLMAVLSGAIFYSPNWLGNDNTIRDLPSAMQQSGATVWGGGIWAIAAVVGAVLLRQRQGRWLWSVNLVAMMAFVAFSGMPAIAVIDTLRQLPLRQLATEIVQQQRPQEPVLMVGFQKPSLVFYSQRPILYVPKTDAAAERVQRASQASPSPSSMLVLGLGYKIDEMQLPAQSYQRLAEAGKYDLIRVNLPFRNQ